jgi:general secretion pathway protein L
MADDATPISDGLIVLLPTVAGEAWRWWRVGGGKLGGERGFDPDDDRPWGTMADDARITALVPAALAPVEDKPLPAMPVPQALAAERLALTGRGLGAGERHVAVAVDGERLLAAGVAGADMDLWLGELAVAGLDPDALVPAGLLLPRPDAGAVTGEIAGQSLARTLDAAFAGEGVLVEALAGEAVAVALDPRDVLARLLAVHVAPPLNLRQGAYGQRRVSFFRVPAWGQLARMAAVAALLALALMVTWVIKWNRDSSVREEVALAAVQAKFPSVTDLDSAERAVAAELARRGTGGSSFSAAAAAVLSAMQPVPGVKLRDLGYSADGTLRFTAAAPRAEDVNVVLLALQADGWKVTVPPALAPDPTGATVAAITVRAP